MECKKKLGEDGCRHPWKMAHTSVKARGGGLFRDSHFNLHITDEPEIVLVFWLPIRKNRALKLTLQMTYQYSQLLQ